MTDVLHHAFEYRDMGLSVLPLNGKRPVFAWRHLIRRRPTHQEIKHWFAKGGHNVGIICGRISGVVALDADDRDTAIKVYRQLPRTAMMTRTGKGVHFYYQIRENQRVAPAVRVRGEGSYCVAAPSIHPETGQPYRRIGSWNLAEVPYFDPSWIDKAEADGRDRAGSTRTIKDAKAYTSQIRAISGQAGHKATFRAACILRDSGMTPDQALATLIEWNQTNAEPPWALWELQHKVRDAYKAVRE